MPVQTVSISTPNGKMGECAETQDLKGSCDSGGEGKGGSVHSEKRDLTSTLRAVDKLVVLDFEVHMLEGGTCGYMYGLRGYRLPFYLLCPTTGMISFQGVTSLYAMTPRKFTEIQGATYQCCQKEP